MKTKKSKKKNRDCKNETLYIYFWNFETVYLDELTQKAEDEVFNRLMDRLIEQEVEGEKNDKNNALQVQN